MFAPLSDEFSDEERMLIELVENFVDVAPFDGGSIVGESQVECRSQLVDRPRFGSQLPGIIPDSASDQQGSNQRDP